MQGLEDECEAIRVGETRECVAVDRIGVRGEGRGAIGESTAGMEGVT